MHFLKTLFIGASAFAAAVTAQGTGNLAFTSTPTSVTVGQSANITFSGASGPATIILRKGNPQNLATISTLTTSATGGSFLWTPDSSLVSGTDYALEIDANGLVNFSGQFAIVGGQPQASTVSSGLNSTITAAPTSKNATIASTVSASSVTNLSRNTTMSSATLKASTTTGTATTTATTSAAGSTGTSAPSSSAAGLSSPLAIVLCAVAAMLYLN
ncbi:MAG: hypothetical protein M1824_004870 [Vezdaea acicularis]|nr:MAG: hypothetical protein M1824_004870 [Vezdaea acicularis]